MTKIIIAVAAAMMLFALGFWYFTRPKTGYINLTEAFDQFAYTKKLRNQLNIVKNVRQKELDSIGFELNVMAEKLSKAENKDLRAVFEVSRKELMMLQKKYSEENQMITDQYDAQIHKQLKSYLAEFGKEYNYDYLYGTEELGTILFARDGYNVTAKVTEYINNKFNAKK